MAVVPGYSFSEDQRCPPVCLVLLLLPPPLLVLCVVCPKLFFAESDVLFNSFHLPVPGSLVHGTMRVHTAGAASCWVVLGCLVIVPFATGRAAGRGEAIKRRSREDFPKSVTLR